MHSSLSLRPLIGVRPAYVVNQDEQGHRAWIEWVVRECSHLTYSAKRRCARSGPSSEVLR